MLRLHLRLAGHLLTALCCVCWLPAAATASLRQRAKAAGAGGSEAQVPNLIDVLARLPERRVPLALAARRKDGPLRAAVCMTGHVRTFVLPGVFSSYAENVVGTGDAEVDLYFMGHLKSMFFRGKSQGHTSFPGPQEESDPELQKALAFPGLNLKHVEIHETGICKDIKKLWREENATGKYCPHDHEMQFQWFDRCIEKAMQADVPYDVIIKTRPDIGVFAPIPWGNISRTHVNYMPRKYGSGEDWFFSLPTLGLDGYWGLVREQYIDKKYKFAPDHLLFPHHGDPSAGAAKFRSFLEPLQFPAAIVRNESFVDCERLPPKPYGHLCQRKVDEGYFATLHEGGHPIAAPGPRRRLQCRGCQ